MSWRTRGGHDVWTLAGIGVVAISAAVLSFASLQDLAQRAGYTPALAALLPVAIDAQAVVATRAWLAASTPARARGYARTLALGAVGLSVLGNAGAHAMAEAAAATPWWVVVLIAAVPPAALAATAHLGALLATRPVEVEAAVPVGAVGPAVGVESTDSTSETAESRPTHTRRSTPTRTTTSTRSAADLRSEFAAAVEAGRLDPASAESIRKTLRCSAGRARQLRDEHARAPRLAVVGEPR